MARVLGWLIAACVLDAARAAAHAPPQVLEVLDAPDMSRIVLVTNRGLLIGTRFTPEPDFRMMCHLALAIPAAERPELALLSDGTMLAATSAGLQSSADGCAWEAIAAFEGRNASALAQTPDARETLYVAGFVGSTGTLQVSHDGAETFEVLEDATDFVHQLVLAPTRAERIYSVRQAITGGGYYLSVSDDGGSTWERRAAPLLSSEGGLELLAVSPEDPDFVLGKGLDNDPTRLLDRVLLSRDGARTFESPLSVEQLFDAAFSADGSTIWVAGIGGLWRSDDAAATFTQLPAATRMSCAQERGGVLLGCGFYADLKDGIGISADRGASFQPLLEFPSVVETIACGDDTPTARACEMLWHDWEREILGIWDAGVPPVTAVDAGPVAPTSDAGTPDAGERPSKRRGGCDAAPASSDDTAAAALSLALLALGLCRLAAKRAR